MRTHSDYRTLQGKLQTIEQAQGFRCYLTDECVDAENVGMSDKCEGYWEAMCATLVPTAYSRADEQGLDLYALGFNEKF